MKLYVKDIEKIWGTGSASLVAGKNGIMRQVEVFDMMEQPNIKPWLKEHLILITTGYAIRNDKEALLKLIRDMNEINASALAIKTRFFDQFPKEALELANELNFPLFFLDNNAGFVELVFPVMSAIMESRNNVALDTRYQIGRQNKSELDSKLFFDLLNGKITQTEEAEYRAISLQWPSEPLRLIAISLETDHNSILLEMKKDRQIKAADWILENNHICHAVVCRKEMCFCIIDSSATEQQLNRIVSELIDKTTEINSCSCFAITSDIFYEYLNLPDIYQGIKEGFRIRKIRKQEWTHVFLNTLQYDRIMLQTAQRTDSRLFIQQKLGPLEQYDREHDTMLLETIETLIRNKNSRKAAAEALFLHRNTMIHRIHKIEEILNINLDNAEEMNQIEFAINLKLYIQ